jgi:hypothetical protein
LCIGQVVPSMQHAIRASGVACQPAQTATFPAHKAKAATSAAARRNIVTVHLACGTQPIVSNRSLQRRACRHDVYAAAVLMPRETSPESACTSTCRLGLPTTRKPWRLTLPLQVCRIARLMLLDLIA